MSSTRLLQSTTEAATEPDIEDLIDLKATSCPSTSSASPHELSRHDFQSLELQTVRAELLTWYDVHRRKLPWRGDLPPYLTTSTHSNEQKKKTRIITAVKKSGVHAFFKVPGQKEVKRDTTSGAAGAVDYKEQVKEPRKVAPYETWVSEIMLQQTRVDTDVNALWAGLGYYRRARMLHAGAKYVVEKYGGELPSTVDQLLLIPGIGPYTAVDGNVIRVMARMRAVGADPKNKQLIKFSWKTASELVRECDRPGALNQALMELGATTCTVQNPRCSDCPVKSVCLAYEEKHVITPKSKRPTTPHVPVESSSACTICDFTRSMEWNESQTEVTKYPLKAKKNDSRQEIICVAVVSSPSDKSATSGKGSSTTRSNTESMSCSSNWKFLMSKRPEGGLLAGQWEFLHSKVRCYTGRCDDNTHLLTIFSLLFTQISDGDTIPPFSKRKAFMDTRLSEVLEQSALSRSSKLLVDRRNVGELTHVFSHVKHHMGIEHLHFKEEPELLSKAKSDDIRWMTVTEMQQLGITTGVKKIFNLVLHPDKAAIPNATKKAKSKATSSLTRPMSHVADGRKRLKSIACFFQK
uniref:Adenine DNA glycosylase n=1 Tax=Hyaloperonospora arabidopsidis (strain Emoy2) TaxID=559515 RepID=M4BEK6_HYAAE